MSAAAASSRGPAAAPRGAEDSGRNAIIDAALGYRKAKVLTVAAYLDIFDQLEAPRPAAAVARRLSLDPRATEILLDALSATGWVRKSGRRYRNTPDASRFLVRGRPQYLGNNLKFQEIIWDAWGELRHSVKRGGAVRPLDYWLLKHDGFLQEYIRGMEDIARGPAEELARLVELGSPARMLDVGAGPGTYSLAFLRRNPGLEAVLLDLPETLKVTRDLLERHPEFGPRIRFLPSDYRNCRLEPAAYDLILLSHVTHDEGIDTNRRLLSESYRALKPGGRIVIHDFMVSPDRVRPEFGALFSVHMLTYTSSGRTYAAEEYAGWLRKAGFKRIARRPVAPRSLNRSEALLAVK